MLISISILLFIISISFIYYKECNINDNIVAMNGSSIDTTNMISIMLEQSDGTYSKSTSNTWPDSSTYTFDSTKSSCENDGDLTWDSTNNIVIFNGTSSDKCYAYFSLSTKTLNKVHFNYTGGEQTFTVPETGEYTFFAWGAGGGGGSVSDSSNSTITTVRGGYGGFATGTITLEKGTILYINVGGSGSYCTGANCTADGGYNGGGNCKSYWESSVATCGSGGGATSVALHSGVLSTLENYKDDILIVAGGGGGAMYTNSVNYANGGNGGGFIGDIPEDLGSRDYENNGGSITYGGKQTSYVSSSTNVIAGKFGTASSATENFGGGGGGFYGGSSNTILGGAGGSGYIGNSKLKNKYMVMYYITGITNESYEYSTKTYTNGCVTTTSYFYAACSTSIAGALYIYYYTYE